MSITKKGFTIIETLVTITIVLISVSVSFLILSRNIEQGIKSRQQLEAQLLAQEVLEYISRDRDTALIQHGGELSNTQQGPSWLGGVPSSCIIDSNTLQLGMFSQCAFASPVVDTIQGEEGLGSIIIPKSNTAYIASCTITNDCSCLQKSVDDDGNEQSFFVGGSSCTSSTADFYRTFILIQKGKPFGAQNNRFYSEYEIRAIVKWDTPLSNLTDTFSCETDSSLQGCTEARKTLFLWLPNN